MAHREEFAKLESSSSVRIQELTANLEAEREKIRAYEHMEMELDDAIVHAGYSLAERGGVCRDVYLCGTCSRALRFEIY